MMLLQKLLKISGHYAQVNKFDLRENSFNVAICLLDPFGIN